MNIDYDLINKISIINKIKIKIDIKKLKRIFKNCEIKLVMSEYDLKNRIRDSFEWRGYLIKDNNYDKKKHIDIILLKELLIILTQKTFYQILF